MGELMIVNLHYSYSQVYTASLIVVYQTYAFMERESDFLCSN